MSGKMAFLAHTPYYPLVEKWVLRVTLGEGLSGAICGERNSILHRHFQEIIAPGRKLDQMTATEVDELIRARLNSFPDSEGICNLPLFANMAMLRTHLNLSEAETDLLALRCLIRYERLLEWTFESLIGNVSTFRLTKIIAFALGRDADEIEAILHLRSPLFLTGLIGLDDRIGNVAYKLDLYPGITAALQRRHDSIDSLLEFAVALAKPGTLCIDDFPHIAKEVSFLKMLLKGAVTREVTGVNILIHGIPGTGKTELVKALSSDLGLKLYEVGCAKSNGDSLRPWQRFSSYMLNQRIHGRRHDTLLMFDEIEDVIPTPSVQIKSNEEENVFHKAWFNKLLEENEVPAIWISNHIEHIDPAYLRRFDYILELRVPPRSVRKIILQKRLASFMDQPTLDRLAEIEQLTPALIAKTAKVLDMERESSTSTTADMVIGGHLEAQGIPYRARHKAFGEVYSLDYLNTDAEIGLLVEGLKSCSAGNICFYGPPGTGKTALAHYLARQVDLPLVVKRASDLISPWLGETEKNLARMFRDAEQEKALLLLDEADSFLQDRRLAQRSWEVTEVNELLTQMEDYDGLFVCATNFLSYLDGAALRRFSLKIRFDYLRPEQRLAMFLAFLQEHGVDETDDLSLAKAKSELGQLHNLTPGDFAAVRRRWKMSREIPSAQALLMALQDECRLKPDGGRKKIGFAA